ncbi:phospholipase D-like domain-containing protein [Bdellovibrio sp. HCB337]|uniref:phospholipase D-like domain-containing protein n=1 Tax=Bdellovibrio sp. HCB337 TaxID=3394358 RepID=UPI0039A664DB
MQGFWRLKFRQLLTEIGCPVFGTAILVFALVFVPPSETHAGGAPLCSQIFVEVKTIDARETFTAADVEVRTAVEQNRAQVKALLSADEALMAKLLAIRSAKQTLDISYYIFSRDKGGYLILNEVKEAVKRGVTVRLMVDSVGSMHITHTELLALIQMSQKEGMGKIEIVTINPWTTLPRALARIGHMLTGRRSETVDSQVSLNNRSHDKILLVDAATPEMLAIIGSRNIADGYFGLNRDGREAFRDVELMIRPPAGEANTAISDVLQTYYNRLFSNYLNKALAEKLYRFFRVDYTFEVDRMEKTYEEYVAQETVRNRLAEMQNQDFLKTGFEDSAAGLVHEIQNLTHDKEHFVQRWKYWRRQANPDSLMRSLKESILNAKKKVTIVSPYPLLGKRDIRMLKIWLLKNPQAEFELIANSTATNDSFVTQAVFDQYVAPALLKLKQDPAIGDRLRVYSYHGLDAQKPELKGNLLHAKIAIIDGKDVLIGTSNFDPRSRIHNSEMGVWLDGAQTVEQFQSYSNSLIAKSYSWGAPEWHQAREKGWGKYQQILQQYIYRLTEALGGIHML